MRLLTSLIVGLFIPFFTLAVSSYDPQKCLKQSLNAAHYDEIFGRAGIHKGIYSQKEIEELNTSGAIKMSADLQLQLADQVAGIPADFKPARVNKQRGRDGKEGEIVQIGLYRFHPEFFRDPKKRSEILKAVCERVAEGVASDMCIKAIQSKMDYLATFYKKHDSKINSMKDSVVMNPQQNWTELGRGYDFTYEPDKDLPLASMVYMDTQEVMTTAEDALRGLPSEGLIRMVADSSGKIAGFALPIGTEGGKVELYLIPNVGSSEKPLFLNPYYFVFGGTSATDWNRKFGVGELKLVSQ